MALSVDQFLERLAASGLSADDARKVLASFPNESRPTSGDDFARVLVEQKVLTEFQAHTILDPHGQRLGLGQYVLLDKIGQGGMGSVFKALHRHMRREVAIKVLHADLAESHDALQRFQREMRAGGKLNHPHIVPTLDADQVGDTMFLVMEYVPGTNLALLVGQNGPLPIEQALSYVAHAAEGLAHAHDQGVIHRDIKPSNLLCDERGNVRVLDLGLARFAADGQAQQTQLTGTGELLGTVDYMAPEQALSTRKADARSDIYSLGCTLAYLLTGQPPFGGESVLKRLMAHRDTPVPSLCEKRHDVPDAVNRIFQKMVAKQPAERYQSMRELLADLEPFVGSRRARSRRWQRGILATVAVFVMVAAVLILRLNPNGKPDFKRQNKPEPPAAPRVAPALAIAPFDESQATELQLSWSKYLDVPLGLKNEIGMALILIPPGEFQQGASDQEVEEFSKLEGRSLASDGPLHRVRLTQPFYIGITEVTQAEYQAVIGSNPSMFAPTGEFADRVADSDTTKHPVENVTWFDAIEFCNALSLREKFTPCYERNGDDVTIVSGTGYRLPTEAEWEFVCRAGTETPWSFGGQEAPFEQFAWVAGNGEFRSHPVGQLLPNAFKLHDLHGNLWEWCQDVFDPRYYESLTDAIAVDPLGPPPAGVRCMRGGVWDNTIRLCRSAHRGANQPTAHNASIGFRVVRTIIARPAGSL